MGLRRIRSALIALVALGLLVTTVMAASPSPSPLVSTRTSPDPSQAGSQAKESPKHAVTESPEPSETAEPAEPADVETPGTPPTADQVARVVAALKAAGIAATADQVGQLMTQLGQGQAVRVLAFANAAHQSPDAILKMFQSGKGWGQIKKDLSLSIGPGIGWIMGHGHGGGPKANPKP
jgi:predicted lipid-binding transport protein (Tim44 family)